MYNPISTYRIQFNKDFTFKNFKDNLEYFTQLGVGTIYASPVFKSTPGSVHGYDVTDPHVFNPEIGNEQEFDEIIEQLKKHNIGWIQDIVPNHMALHKDNQWLMDVLKKGTTSPYSNYFDINFSHPDFKGKLLIPFIGKPVKEAIAEGEIKLSYIDGNWGFSYYDFFFPASEETEQELSASNQSTDEINSDPKKIEALLNQQHYQLAYWQEASQHLNYRRFFTINSLISLAMEGNEVFKDYHSFIANLVRSGKINGLRIDHVDGLKEPANYVEKLRVLTGDDIYMVVEKILQANEQVVTDWPLEGTTGYDFLGMVNNLFTFAQGYPQLRKFYQEFTSLHEDPEEIIYQKKKLILFTSKQGDLDNLCRLFEEGNFIDPKADITHEQIRNAIAEFLVCFPRYKSYSWFFPLSSEDKKIVDQVIRKAETKNPSLKRILSVLRNLFIDQQGLSDEQRESALQFYLRCMQYTGPLMAKGVEDTVMYHYNCFIAHNEVGDAVNASGLSIREFHEKMVQRQKTLPLTQNATATHDTKRGEDARARLNVISETAQDWFKAVRKWSGINDSLKQSINGKKVPSANEEYFIYQTLVGIFPFNGIAEETLLGRLDEYMIKSLR
jgi:malto-oligosyltrehalose synthase